MKKVVYAVLGLAFATSVARAEPTLTETAPVPETQPTSYYLAGGALAGIDTVAVFGAATVDGGYHLARTPLWLHGMVADGSMLDFRGVTYTSAYLQVRGGVESRGCLVDDFVCGIAGLDVGIAHESLMTGSMHAQFDGAQLIPRAMLDLGTRHVRVRPGIEAIIDRNGFDGLGFTGALAFVW